MTNFGIFWKTGAEKPTMSWPLETIMTSKKTALECPWLGLSNDVWLAKVASQCEKLKFLGVPFWSARGVLWQSNLADQEELSERYKLFVVYSNGPYVRLQKPFLRYSVQALTCLIDGLGCILLQRGEQILNMYEKLPLNRISRAKLGQYWKMLNNVNMVLIDGLECLLLQNGAQIWNLHAKLPLERYFRGQIRPFGVECPENSSMQILCLSASVANFC